MTLSVLSGSAIGGVTLGLAYVFGMVFPLFVMALVWDRARLGERGFLRAKPVTLRLGARSLRTNTVNIAVAATFVAMGGLVIALAGSVDMTGGTQAQDWASETLTTFFTRVQEFLSPVPEWIQGASLLAVVVLFIWATLRERRPSAPTPPADKHEGSTPEQESVSTTDHQERS